MKSLVHAIDRFFFGRIAATGFGLMRVAWAATSFAWLLMQWQDIVFYYSGDGMIAPGELGYYIRQDHWFSILYWVTDAKAVFALYILLLLLLLCSILGVWVRFTTILAVVLSFSFQERNTLPLAGGETVLRLIGFLLVISPCIRAISLDRVREQWRQWKESRTLLPPLTMPAWPMRLLLWQLIVLYVSAFWYKMLGTLWIEGTAIVAALHHPIFTRVPQHFINLLVPFMPFADRISLLWQGMWVLLLFPRAPLMRMRWLGDLRAFSLKRLLLFGGILFHGAIFLLMDAGSFSIAVFSAYLGTLVEEDFAFMRRLCKRFFLRGRGGPKQRIAVLYDGRCGLCMRSALWIAMLDTLGRLTLVDFRNEEERKRYAPSLTEGELDKAMHVLVPGRKQRAEYGTQKALCAYKGFDGFRVLAWHLLALWPFVPFLYFPGVAFLGRKIYARVAARRKRCKHGECKL